MSQELLTAVQEHVKLTVVLVQNHGFASIGSLSESIGSERFGTAFRYRDPISGRLDGDVLPVDLVANAAGLGVVALRVRTVAELSQALVASRAETRPVLIEVETDPLVPAPDSESWWDVPIAEVAEHAPTARARKSYEQARTSQKRYL
jgi:3D-(3,5/4)-trihydroxycyclohexane-1,2-dione acylhydrolase (decyclizing)